MKIFFELIVYSPASCLFQNNNITRDTIQICLFMNWWQKKKVNSNKKICLLIKYKKTKENNGSIYVSLEILYIKYGE